MKTVVLVDSDVDGLHLLKEITEDAGYHVLGTERIEHGLDILKRGVHVDGILVSMAMREKGMSVKTFCSHEMVRRIPCIGIVSSIRTNESAEARTAGCVGIVAKPFSESDVVREIKRVIG